MTHERRRWIALVTVCLGQVMVILDSTVVNVALPSIQADLDLSQTDLTWVVNAYLVTYGGFLLMAGRLGDLLGRKRVFLAGVTLFTLASLACAAASTSAALIAARLGQGVGGAIASAGILAIIMTEFPEPAERTKAMSAYLLVVVAGGSLGLVVGGPLTEALNWHWIFAINVPIGIGTVLLGARLIHDHVGLGIRNGIDVPGSVAVTAAVMLGIYAIVDAPDRGWLSARTLGVGLGALALLAAFVLIELRTANPVMPLRVFRIRSLMTSSGLRAVVVIAMYAAWFFGALYLQKVLGYGPVRVGLAFLPMTLASAALTAGLAGRLMARVGPQRLLLAGLAAMLGAFLLLTGVDGGTGYLPRLLAAFALFGAGAGAAFLPLTTTAMADVPARDAGLGSGIYNVTMYIASALGLAVLGAVATGRTDALLSDGTPPSEALVGGYRLVFWIGAALVALAALAASLLMRPRPAPVPAPAPARL